MNHFAPVAWLVRALTLTALSTLSHLTLADALPMPGYCEPAWTFATQGPNFAAPAVEGDMVLIGSGDGFVYALDAATGQPRWRFVTGAAADSMPVVADGQVFVQSRDGYFYSLDANTGELVWRKPSGEPGPVDFWDFTLAPAATAGGMVLFGSGDGSLYALSQKDGEPRWRVHTNGALRGQPLIVDDGVFLGSFDGYFRALDLATGELLWQFKTVGSTYFPEGAIQGSASHHDGIVYFGSRDYNLYALNAETGTGRWNQRTLSWVIGAPLIYDDRVYFGTSDSLSLHATDRLTGKPDWDRDLRARLFAEPVAHEGRIYLGAFNGLFHAIDPADGTVAWRFATAGNKTNRRRVYDAAEAWQDDFRQMYGEGQGMEAEQLILQLGSIASRVAIYDDLIIFASTDHHIYAVPAESPDIPASAREDGCITNSY